jgi:condensin complex subunit 2
MERLPNLINTTEESSWQKASASLDASAKIYGFRVDSVHSETFKFLGGLSRADLKEEDYQGDDGEEGVKEKKTKASDKSVIDYLFRMELLH